MGVSPGNLIRIDYYRSIPSSYSGGWSICLYL